MSNERLISMLLMLRAIDRFDESSSSSDDEWQTILLHRLKRMRHRRIKQSIDVVDRFSEIDFKNHFKMSKSTFNFLHGILCEDLIRHVPGCPAIPPRKQLLITLWKLTTTDSYKSVCDRFGVGRATAVRSVRRVTHALFVKAPHVIIWPSGNLVADVMRGFEEKSKFPKVIGAIDGTDIRIKPPKMNSAEYLNCNGYHSVQLQLVCDHKCLITHCYFGHPGSFDDQKIFDLSEIATYLNEEDKFPEDSHILGDGAYQLHERLLTPFNDDGHLTETQKKYNYHHSLARAAVEQCVGLLKGRMKSLLPYLPVARMDLMGEYLIACCVIHNICVLKGDKMNIIMIPASSEKKSKNISTLNQTEQDRGVQKRNVIMNTLNNL